MNIRQKQWIDWWLGYFLVVLFFPLTRFLGITLGRNHKVDKEPDAILFVKILGLGSLVLALDAIKAVQSKYPSSRIILLADKNNAEGIKSFIDGIEIWAIDSSNLGKVAFQSLSILFRTWKFKRLWVCDLEVYSKLTTVFSLFTCAVNRFGFVLQPVQFRKNLNTHNTYFDTSCTYTDNYNALALAMGARVGEVTREVRPTPGNAKNIIAINNTCSDLSIYRKLPDTTLLELIRWILENTSYQIALCGSPNDTEVNAALIEELDAILSKDRLMNIAGLFTFQQYYYFLTKKCVLMFSIDSAPLHIAKKLGLPTISVWGPTNPSSYLKIEEWEKDFHLTLYRSVVCSPCVHDTKELPCGGNNFCMKEIKAEEIVQNLKKLLVTLGKPI